MVCIQCYLPPILFMLYMKLIHPFLAPYLEPALDKVIGWIWGPQAVTQGCPIGPKGKRKLKAEDSSEQPTTKAVTVSRNHENVSDSEDEEIDAILNDEKLLLAYGIHLLSGDKLAEVVQFLKQREPSLRDSDHDEFDIDIKALRESTRKELMKYVADRLKSESGESPPLKIQEVISQLERGPF